MHLPKRRHLLFEHLEARRLLAADLTLIRYFDTWDGGIIPSTDAAGLTFHAPSGHLYLADSEINELSSIFDGNNVFEISLSGDTVFQKFETNNREPTGITYNQFDQFFYITNDDAKQLSRYDDNLNAVLASVDTRDAVSSARDPEGVTSDPSDGRLYVIDGSNGGRQVLAYDADLNFLYDFSVANRMQDAEGIAYDPLSDHLFIVSDPDSAVLEYTLAGTFVNEYDISSFSPSPRSPQGLTFAPTSDPNDDPNALALYIADGMVDNFADGRVYEAVITTDTTNQPPVLAPIGDQSATEGVELTFTATATDPNLPDDTLTFSLDSGAPAGASIDPATGVFRWTPTENDGPASYPVTVRVTDDGVPNLSDSETITITVLEPGSQVVVAESRVDGSSDDAEESSSGNIKLTSSDLELVFDSGGNQTVGMRFNGVDVPRGAVVVNAYVQFQADETHSGDTSLTIRGEDIDHAPTFITSSGNISSRTKTTASVPWSPVPWTSRGEATADQRTPNLATIVQKIVSRSGWSSGNSMVLMITGTGERVAESYNGDQNGAPLLHVEYVAGDVPPVENQPPVLAPIGDQSVNEGVELIFTAMATDPDLPGDTLTFSLDPGAPAGASIDATTGVFRWTTTEDDGPGSYPVTVRVADDGSPNLSDFETITITVNEVSGGVVTVESRVAASSDDAEEKPSGGMRLTSSDLEMVFDRDDQQVGMRFNAVDLPRGAAIVNAYIQFQADEINSGDTSLTVRAEDTDNAPTFTNTSGNISSRNTTTASVPWSPVPWTTKGEAGVDQRTPNLAAVVQKIVSRPGWSSGNSMVMIVTGTGERVAESYNGDQAGAPLLHVEYATGGGSGDPPLAVDDSATTAEDTTGVTTVLTNDDLGSVPTSIIAVTQGNNGIVTYDPASGTTSYTPEANFNGPDSYTYTIIDSLGQTSTATVDVTVTEVNDVPVLTAGAVNDLAVAVGSGTTSLGLGALAYGPGGGSDEIGQILSYAVTLVPSPILADVVLADGLTVVTAGVYTLSEIQGMQFRVVPSAAAGLALFSFTATDDGLTDGSNDPKTLVQTLTVTVADGTTGSTVFAVIGDYGRAGPDEEDVANLVKSWNPDFIITTGDNNYPDGAASTIDENIGQYYHEFIYPYVGSYGAGAQTNRFFPSLGNHDWIPPHAKPYLDYFTLPDNERYYDFTWGSVEFFAIDSDSDEPDGNSSTSVQAAWLQSELAMSTATWKIVYMHHSPYSSALHGSSGTRQWPFQEWGASVVLGAHDHTYERIVQSDFPYFVNGAGGNELYSFGTPVAGSELRYNDDFGAMRVEASDTQLTFQFISRMGTIVDTYTMTADPNNPLPTVSMTDTDVSASEPGNDTATLTLDRTGDVTAALTVNYTVAGTATNGADYGTLDGTLTIPAGAASVPLEIIPLDDTLAEGAETIVVTLTGSTFYNLDASYSVTITIADDEAPALPVTVESRVVGSSDDAEQDDTGDMSLGSTDLEMVFDDSDQTVGIRFNNLEIPQNASIVNAYVQFQVDETTSETTSLTIQGEDTDHALTFTSSGGNISSRPKTTASVSWTPVPWMLKAEAGPDQQTPNLAPVIQQIVSRPGWSTGNSLAIFVTGTGKRVAESYNGDPTGAPLLHVEYVLPDPTQNQPPVLAAIGSQFVEVESTLSFTATAIDANLPDDTLTFSLDPGAPAGANIDPVSGVFSWTPSAVQGAGNYPATVRVTDGRSPSLSDFEAITITVFEPGGEPGTVRVPQEYSTIQAAVDAAADGDVVLVSPGTYNESIVIAGKSVTLASLYHTTGDEAYIDQTVIDAGGGLADVIVVDATAGPDTTIVGLTIQNGNDGVSAFRKVNIFNNRVTGNADGLDLESSGGVVRGNLIELNSDDGIDLDRDTEVIIEDNILRNNSNDGIEARFQSYSGPTLNIVIRNNVISGNDDDGIQLIGYPDESNRSLLIEGNLIVNNGAVGLGLMDDGNTTEDFRAASLVERIHLFNNTFAGNLYGVTGGDNMVAVNNLFVDTTNIAVKEIDGNSTVAYNLFFNNGTDNQGSNLDGGTTLSGDPLLDSNYQLQTGSPAIDAGTAHFEFSGEVVLDLPTGAYAGAAPDLGAYESGLAQAAATPSSSLLVASTDTVLVPQMSSNWLLDAVLIDGGQRAGAVDTLMSKNEPIVSETELMLMRMSDGAFL